MTEHEHEWGPVELSRFGGNPHRKCVDGSCWWVLVELTNDNDNDNDNER